jgi:hypothetical protein
LFPQIVAAALGGVIFKYVTNESSIYMLLIAGVLLIFGAFSVFAIKEK